MLTTKRNNSLHYLLTVLMLFLLNFVFMNKNRFSLGNMDDKDQNNLGINKNKNENKII